MLSPLHSLCLLFSVSSFYSTFTASIITLFFSSRSLSLLSPLPSRSPTINSASHVSAAHTVCNICICSLIARSLCSLWPLRPEADSSWDGSSHRRRLHCDPWEQSQQTFHVMLCSERKACTGTTVPLILKFALMTQRESLSFPLVSGHPAFHTFLLILLFKSLTADACILSAAHRSLQHKTNSPQAVAHMLSTHMKEESNAMILWRSGFGSGGGGGNRMGVGLPSSRRGLQSLSQSFLSRQESGVGISTCNPAAGE